MNNNMVTDNLDQFLDVVDESDMVIGSATRRECNSNPNLIHRAAYALIFSSDGRLFLHKRSNTKDTCPSLWSISVAGHVDQGETYEQTIRREIIEEIGIDLKVEYLEKYLLRHINESEFSAVFRAYSDGPFKLNKKEIEKGGFFRLDVIRKKMWGILTPFSQMVLTNLTVRGLI
ncbi:Mutator MutT protein [uncultured Desulfobacterium sp.]|uniref:Mutator MutT protein n=1 Tax=uncultured Desulfobacterium sp. TaxID=201089 RepID=A0A445N2T0_9BACT|nr:Mutator MutT protein [uncultured Desulfobacterium sp.]